MLKELQKQMEAEKQRVLAAIKDKVDQATGLTSTVEIGDNMIDVIVKMKNVNDKTTIDIQFGRTMSNEFPNYVFSGMAFDQSEGAVICKPITIGKPLLDYVFFVIDSELPIDLKDQGQEQDAEVIAPSAAKME